MKLDEYQQLTERTAGEFEDLYTELIEWSMGIGG